MKALERSKYRQFEFLCKKRLWLRGLVYEQVFPCRAKDGGERSTATASPPSRRRHERLLTRASNHIAVELRNQGLYPSAARINEHLPQGSCREWKALALAIRDAQRLSASPSKKIAQAN